MEKLWISLSQVWYILLLWLLYTINENAWLTGAAAKPDNSLSDVTSSANMKFAAATGGFAYGEITKDYMTIKMIDSSANELYTYSRERTRYFSSGGNTQTLYDV